MVQSEKECFICHKQTGLHRHHIYGGTANRRISERLGYVVWLCAEHHTGDSGVHHDRDLDLYVKRTGQRVFEQTRTREEFIATFGRNYIE